MRRLTMPLAGLALLLATAEGRADAGRPGNEALLLQAYLRYVLHQNVAQQAARLGDSLPGPAGEEIRREAQGWVKVRNAAAREPVDGHFGDQAVARFRDFVAAFTQAEHSGDAAYLTRLAAALPIEPAPADYAALRAVAVERFLMPDVARASEWMSRLQTWAEHRQKSESAVPLSVWMGREALPAAGASGGGPRPAARPARGRPADPLAEAEASTEVPGEMPAEAASPLDDFTSMRDQKRQQALEEARQGMQQVAAERQAAESEYAARKTAEARAQAEALKHQAEVLAAAEKEALQQRERSWGNRLKNIVGGTVSAAGGAFFGGIGTRAGEEAVDAIFND